MCFLFSETLTGCIASSYYGPTRRLNGIFQSSWMQIFRIQNPKFGHIDSINRCCEALASWACVSCVNGQSPIIPVLKDQVYACFSLVTFPDGIVRLVRLLHRWSINEIRQRALISTISAFRLHRVCRSDVIIWAINSSARWQYEYLARVVVRAIHTERVVEWRENAVYTDERS